MKKFLFGSYIVEPEVKLATVTISLPFELWSILKSRVVAAYQAKEIAQMRIVRYLGNSGWNNMLYAWLLKGIVNLGMS